MTAVMGEQEPLLRKLEKDSDTEKASVTWDRDLIEKGRSLCGVRLIGVAVCYSLIAVGLLVALVGTAVSFANFLRHQPGAINCHDIPSFIATNTRSGRYSLLDTISVDSHFLLCYKPRLQVSLNSRYSQVDVYQSLCRDLETNSFQTLYVLDNIKSSGDPWPVFNENYSPHNYFTEGTIRVDIINASRNASLPVDINMCLFISVDDYNHFMRSGRDWKNSTKNCVCKSNTIKEAGENFIVSFNISKPSFVFIAMVTTNYVHIDRLNISATGREITGPGKNHSNKVCQLDGENTAYIFDLIKQQSGNQNLCIVAYEVGNADGSYDYSELIVSLPEPYTYNPYCKGLQGFGYTLLGVVIVSIALSLAIIIICHCKQTRRPVTCEPIPDSNRHGPSQKKDPSTISLFHKV